MTTIASTRRGILAAAIVSLTALSAASTVQAAAGVEFGAAPGSFTSSLNATRGWEFTVLQSLDVTALGLWDEGANGFAQSHEVGLWDDNSVLLASITMPSGPAGSLTGPDNFRYLTLGSAVTLASGTYRIGAYYVGGSADRIAQNANPQGAAGFVTFVGATLNNGGALSDPTSPSSVLGGPFGANFLFNASNPTTPVPEPGSALVGMLALGLCGTRLGRRSRRQ